MIPFVLAVANVANPSFPPPRPAIYAPAVDVYVVDDLFLNPQLRIGSAGLMQEAAQ